MTKTITYADSEEKVMYEWGWTGEPGWAVASVPTVAYPTPMSFREKVEQLTGRKIKMRKTTTITVQEDVIL